MSRDLSDADKKTAQRVRKAFARKAAQRFARPETVGSVLPAEICHYTDAAGAQGIIAGHELWASHALFMNDSMELRLSEPVFERALEDELPKTLADRKHRTLLIDGFQAGYQAATADPGIYLVCFSTHDDQLGQWRGYGFAGGGYSLAYDAAQVSKMVIDRPELELVEVIYDVVRQRNVAGQVVRSAGHATAELIAEQPDRTELLLRTSGFALAQFALSLAYRFKDPAFAEENEWRLIYRANLTEGPALERSFRVAGSQLLPFVRIPTAAQNEGDDKEDRPALDGLVPQHVRVGPTAAPQLAELSMRYLLDDAMLSDVPVEHSAVPLRA